MPNLVSLLALGTLLTAPVVAHADLTITTPETLMEAQIGDVLALQAYAGVDYSTSLQSTFTLDTGIGSFSYSQVSGQTYLGQPLSLSGSGTYDQATTTFNWTDSGELGSDLWSGSGQLQWGGDDPTAAGLYTLKIKNTSYPVTFRINLHPTGPARGTSDGEMDLDFGGGKIWTYKITDTYAPYTWTARTVQDGTVGTGTWTYQNNGTGPTTSTWGFTTVPEPASISLAIVPMMLLLVSRMRHRK